jgi:hypothetical integral membrane protein (TIGR02206 family)
MKINELELDRFQLFGTLHIGVLTVAFVGVLLVLAFRSQTWLRFLLAGVLIAQVITFNIYHITNNSYDIARFLPLHLCTVSAILAPIALITRNNVIKDLVLFWGLIPAFLAILLPDMGASDGLTSFRFWEFFVSHTFIVLSAVYLSIHSYSKFSLSKFDTWKKIIISFTVLVLYSFGFVYPLNKILGSNYLYLMGKASNGMGFLPDGTLYLPTLIFLSLIVFIATAVIYWVLNIFKRYGDKNAIL